MLSQSDESKESALRAVGRTVVNFQRLEHNLKLAARAGALSGPVRKVEEDIAKRCERASELSLGQAIQAWLELSSGQGTVQVETLDLFDVSLRVSLSLEFDAGARDHHAKALREILKIRNDLIHSRLATFDWESYRACSELVAELATVNAAISEQLDYTSSLVNAIAEIHGELAGAALVQFENGALTIKETMPNEAPERSRDG